MIRIYGCSDDLVEIECPGRSDELSVIGEDAEIMLGWDEPQPGEGTRGLVVTVAYDGPGTWTAKLSQIDDGAPIPWPVTVKAFDTVRARVGYSVVVEIDAPDDVPIRWRVRQSPDSKHVESSRWRDLGDRSSD